VGNEVITDPERKACVIAAEYATLIATQQLRHNGAPFLLPVPVALMDDSQLP
jgi:hypothetical protein